jgi:DNA-binding transcriptional MerR regulator
MKIGELSRRTDISTRMLRYYEEQGLLTAERDANDYRSYAESSAGRALQIRGLLDSGLTTEIIRDLLPCLADGSGDGSGDGSADGSDNPGGRLTPPYLSTELASALSEHLERIQKRIDCLTRNRDAVRSYIAGARGPG